LFITHIILIIYKPMQKTKIMKKIKILYWVFTGLFAALMLFSSIPDILSVPVAVEGFKQMGYPVYLLPFIGTAKLLGVFAILVPGYARIKEWAYAGLVIDLAGATYSIILSGKSAGDAATMILPFILAIGSYVYYHKKQNARAVSFQPVPAIN
jgi:hypothetical protein